jgi:hypothetical protein
MKIFKTKDYEAFNILKGNRKVYPNHVSKLCESIKKKNYLEQNPILINGNMVVIDGQHRLEACKILDIPVYWTQLDKSGIKDVHLLNTTSKNWSLTDYIDSYCETGNKHYKLLRDFSSEYKMTPSLSADLLGERNRIKSGKFKVTTGDQAFRVADFLPVFVPYCEKSVMTDRNFVKAVQKMDSLKISQKNFEKKLGFVKEEIRKHGSVDMYLRTFEKIYNWKNRSQRRFF